MPHRIADTFGPMNGDPTPPALPPKALPLWASRLKALRNASGMTQVQIAARAGVTPLTISRLETGAVDPQLSTLQAVTKAYSHPLVSLFMDGGPTPPPMTQEHEQWFIDACVARLRDAVTDVIHDVNASLAEAHNAPIVGPSIPPASVPDSDAGK